MRRVFPESWLEEVGGLDPGAVAQVREEAWPDVRDADELHDVLHTLVALPEESNHEASFVQSLNPGAPSLARSLREKWGFRPSQWGGYFERLLNEGRAGVATFQGRRYWVAAERARSFSTLFPSATFEQSLADVETGQSSPEDALLTLVTGWMSHLGPVTASQLGAYVGLAASETEKGLLRMEASGTVLRGKFTSTASRAEAPTPHEPEIEWCERRLLAPIHRLTVGLLPKHIDPF